MSLVARYHDANRVNIYLESDCLDGAATFCLVPHFGARKISVMILAELVKFRGTIIFDLCERQLELSELVSVAQTLLSLCLRWYLSQH